MSKPRPHTLLVLALITIAAAACRNHAGPPRAAPPPDASTASVQPNQITADASSATAAAPSTDAATGSNPAPASDAGSASGSASDAGSATASATGTITGKILFKGAAPAMPLLDRSRDSNCPQTEARASWLTVSASGAVAGAFVRIPAGAIKAPAGTAPAAKPRAAVIDQHDCLYRPSILGILAGQRVVVRNSDPTSHNVHGLDLDEQTLFNEMHVQGGPDKTLTIDAAPGQAVEVKCDVHPWMETWVVVSDHPYFTITGPDGAFTIANVPAGTYDLEVWHPHLGLHKATVTVEAGKTTTATLPAFAPADVKAPE